MLYKHMLNVQHLDAFLKKYNCFDTLIQLSETSKYLFQKNIAFTHRPIIINGMVYKQTVTQWGLSFIAYRAIMVSNDGKSNFFQERDLLRANHIFGDLFEPFVEDKDLIGFFGRMSQEQFWWQEHFSHSFGRAYFLFNELPHKCDNKLRVNFNDIFNENFGLSIKDFLIIGLTIITRVLDGQKLKKKDFCNYEDIPFLDGILVPSKVEKFLSMSSAPYAKIRALADQINKNVSSIYERYQFNPLFSFPIVERDNRFSLHREHDYIVPNIMLLCRKLTTGVYWEFRDLFRDFPKRYSNDFLISFGELFEQYIGFLLRTYFGDTNVEHIVQDGLQGKKCDWFVSADNLKLLFECKSSLLPFGVRQTYNKETMQKWFEDNILDGICQLDNTEMYLKKEGRLESKDVYKFLVIFENIYTVEESFLKNHLKSLVADKFKKDIAFYILTLNDLESLATAIKNYGIAKIISSKIQLDAENNVSDGCNFQAASKRLGEKEFLNNFLESITDTLLYDIKIG